MKVFLISHDLSGNCLGRAIVLADALRRNHEIEILGPAFGSDIWFPARDYGISYRKVDGELFLPQYTHLLGRLVEKLKGDVMVAVKPRPTSFGVALLRRELTGRPLLLDIDDHEMAYYADADWRAWDTKDLLRRPNSPLYTQLLERLIPTANAITCASLPLVERFGGTYLPHVKDPDFLNPAAHDGAREREQRDFPADEKLILFAGSPRAHKGLELLLSAIRRLERKDVKLLVVGATNDPDNEFEQRLRQAGGESLYLLKQSRLRDLPGILSMADLVVLPQLDVPFAQFQSPSKLFDAMAMALPIVATAVGDMPQVLTPECGRCVPPGDELALAEAIGEMLEAPEASRAMGERARQRLVDHYSIDAVQSRLNDVLAHAATGRVSV